MKLEYLFYILYRYVFLKHDWFVPLVLELVVLDIMELFIPDSWAISSGQWSYLFCILEIFITNAPSLSVPSDAQAIHAGQLFIQTYYRSVDEFVR